jgi:hypothetical protein
MATKKAAYYSQVTSGSDKFEGKFIFSPLFLNAIFEDSGAVCYSPSNTQNNR